MSVLRLIPSRPCAKWDYYRVVYNEVPQAEECEPMRMVLTSHQLGRTFTDSLQDPAAQKTAMVQEKLKQMQVRAGGAA